MTITKENTHIVLYGVMLALLVFVLKWLEWKFLIVDHAIDLYIGLIAVFFTGFGVWIASHLVKPEIQTVVVEKEILIKQPDKFVLNVEALEELDLTPREYEVLQLIAQGHSNAEIARHLFLSVSTIKTHVSNLYAKMEVKNRVQAIEQARKLRIIA